MLGLEIVCGTARGLNAKWNTNAEDNSSKWLVKERTAVNSGVFHTADDKTVVKLALTLLRAGYTRFVIYLEDCVFISPQPGHIACFDIVTGQLARTQGVTLTQLEALVTLAICGDEVEDAPALYAVAEPVIKGWPNACRPIP